MRTGCAWWLGCALALGFAGCKPGASGLDGQGLGPKAADPGASVKLVPGPVEPRLEPVLELQVDALSPSDACVFLAAALPSRVDATGLEPMDVRLEGTRHGLAALTRGRLLVRLTGAEPPSGPLRIVLRKRPGRHGEQSEPVVLQPIDLRVPADLSDPAGEPELRRAFFLALADQFGQRARGWRSDPDGFAAFAEGRARWLADGSDSRRSSGRDRPGPARQSDLGEMMSLYTGVSSVREALQADRGLLGGAGQREARNIPLASLPGVGLAEHPWEELLAGKQPVLEPMASRAPQDTLYVFFRDLRTFVELSRELEELGTPLVQIFENQPGDHAIGPRYEEELMLERLGLAEKLGHLAASGVALLVGDPFLREGTDLAVVFQIKDRAMLLATLDFYELRARKAHPDLTIATLDVQGYEVRLASTPDGSVRQHRVEADGFLLLSNSPAGLERVLRVWRGESPPLARSGDFRYLRSLYPPSEDPREAFVFLPDAFIARAVGPATKIGAARRIAAQAELLAVGYAALLHGWLTGRPPSGPEELRSSGFLRPEELRHEDGGPIAYHPGRGAWSETWGRPHALRPLADSPVELVSAAEQRAYERFRETYQSYWKTYLDPVAARLRWREDGGGLDADVRILPLIENSDYDQLVERAGKTTVGPPILRGAFQWTFAVGEQASLRKELDRIGRGFLPGQQAVLGWLGEWVMAGVLDHSGLWDLAMLAEGIPSSRPASTDGHRSVWQALPRVPLYAGAHVRNKGALAALLIALKTRAEEAAPGMIRWAPGPSYRGVPVVEIASSEEQTGVPKVSVFYATVEDVFALALGRDAIEALIDARLAGKLPATGQGEGQALVDLATLGPDSWLARTALGLMEMGVRSANRQAFRALENLSRGLGGLPAEPAAFRRATLGYLGFVPACPQGGTFLDRGPGRVEHSLYGALERPIFPDLPVPDAPATRMLRSLEGLHMGLAFEGEGPSRGLRALFRLDRRPDSR
jgi:hypothetical protein